MSAYDPRVDAYIEKAADFAKPILNHLRALVHEACPDVEETWKWSFPVFMYRGAIMCNLAAFKEHCSFGFWKASLLADPDQVLTTATKDSMGNLGKITSLADLPADAVIRKFITEAMRLNEEGVKTVKKPKPTEAVKSELQTPGYFTDALRGNPEAGKVYNEFSYSKKKEYIEWLEEAKTEATRSKRMAQAVEWIAEGKSRNWKYQNC